MSKIHSLESFYSENVATEKILNQSFVSRGYLLKIKKNQYGVQ